MRALANVLPETVVVPGLLWARRRGSSGGPGTGFAPLRLLGRNRHTVGPTVIVGGERRWVELSWSRTGRRLAPRLRVHPCPSVAFRSLLDTAPRPAQLAAAQLRSIITETLELISRSWSPSLIGFHHQHYRIWKEVYFDARLASTLLEWGLGEGIRNGLDHHLASGAWRCLSGRLATRLGCQHQWGAWKRDELRQHLASQRADGSLPYEPPDGKLERAQPTVAPGQMAARLLEVVDYATATGDRSFDPQLARALDFLGRIPRLPRGGQTWEIDPHVPDLLASALLSRAFVRAAVLLGDETLLAAAEEWALTSLPFLVLRQDPDRPIMAYATLPAFGVTRDATGGEEWLGIPSGDRQAWWGIACPWVGLELAQSLLELDQLRRDGSLVAVAEGVVATVDQMRARDADVPRRIPDAFNLVDQREEYPMWLVPRNLVEVCSHLLRRRGECQPQPRPRVAEPLVRFVTTVKPPPEEPPLCYPEHAYVDLTGRCNLRCVICPHAYEEGPVSRHPLMSDRVLDRLEGSVFPHAKAVTFSCSGESLLHPRALEVLASASRHTFLPMLIHNGTLLRPEVRDVLVDIGAYLRISVDGASPAVFEAIRVGAHFGQVMRAVRAVVELARSRGNPRFCLRFDTTIHRRNLHELADIVDLAADVGAEQVFVHHLYTDNIPLKNLSLLDSPREVDRALVRALERAVTRGVFLVGPELSGTDPGLAAHAGELRSRLPPDRMGPHLPEPYGPDTTYSCGVPWKDVVVKPDGNVAYCCLLAENVHLGNLEQQTFEEIWFGEGYNRLRRQVNTATPSPQCHPTRCGIRRPFLDGVRLRADGRRLHFTSGYPNRLAYRLEVLRLEREVGSGVVRLELSVTNAGDTVWYSAHSPLAEGVPTGLVRLGAQLLSADGLVLQRDHFRLDLPQNVPPGQTVPLSLSVAPPASGWPSPCQLKVDLVCEGVCWFEQRGQPPLRLTLRDPDGSGPDISSVDCVMALVDPPTWEPDRALSVRLRLTNAGENRWRSAREVGLGELDAGCVRLGAQLWRRNGGVLDRDHHRMDLPHDVYPGATIELQLRVPAPAGGWPDDADLKLDLVLEGSAWFEDRGQLPLVIPIPPDRGESGPCAGGRPVPVREAAPVTQHPPA